ncbi:ribonuclease HI [Roseomonas sp. JC162]|uniref:Ribonuclease H n=1 Tax=Neoroseomonas marina TaxID=1232220 RepID=A0A848EFP9_9PROT|nr:ribonuclease HI [Neoroseomonas marina]NMJ43464.1 ribonuclease HI [Neoroseomonas marina]
MTTISSALAAGPSGDVRRHIEIWTDGSCRPNPGRGGWAAILRNPEGRTRELSGAEPNTTNNRMELRAAIAGLKALLNPSRVAVHADSEYVVRGMSLWLPKWQASRWRTSAGKPVLNADLWQLLAVAAEPHDVTWQWVQGHAGDPMNTRADALASAARDKPEVTRRGA